MLIAYEILFKVIERRDNKTGAEKRTQDREEEFKRQAVRKRQNENSKNERKYRGELTEGGRVREWGCADGRYHQEGEPPHPHPVGHALELRSGPKN